MDNLEIWFFAFGVLLTIVASLVFYFLLYERPPAAFDKQKILRVGDWDIHYTVQGRGPPLLLVHGIGASLHCWHYMIPLLTKHYQVIALDLPGFGRSSKNASVGYGLDEQAERIEQFLNQLKIDRCFVVGNSMGGAISLWLAHRNPDRFPYVVALAPATHPKLVHPLAPYLGFLARPASWMFAKPIAERMHQRTLTRHEQLTDEHVMQTLNVYRKDATAIRTFLSGTAVMRDPRILTTTFKTKVLVLWGAGDRLVPRWAIDDLMPRLTSASLTVHPTGGHQLQEDEPDWTFAQIRSFLPPRL